MIVYLTIDEHVCGGGGVAHERAALAAGHYCHMCTLFLLN